METYTIEDAFRELEDVYEEITATLEAEREEKLREIGDKAIKQIIILLNGGYTETAIRKALKKIGFTPQEIDYLISASWEEMEKRKFKVPKYAGLVLIGIIILALAYLAYSAFEKTRAVPCSSIGCVDEIITCKDGEYYTQEGTIKKTYSIRRISNKCGVYIRVYEALNKSLIGESVKCEFDIINDETDVNPDKCNGNTLLL